MIKSKVDIEITPHQVEVLVDKLPLRNKLRIINKLEAQTLKTRWKGILKDIDKRLKKSPVSQETVSAEIKAYRKEKNAKGRR